MIDGMVTRETFEKSPVEQKLDILFDLMLDIQRRVKDLEGSRFKNAFIQFSGSMIGGGIVILAYLKWIAPLAAPIVKAGGA